MCTVPALVTCITVTECKSLYATIMKENTSLTYRRRSLKAAQLRESLKEVSIKRAKCEQILADCVTKFFSRGYARLVVASILWTLGPDERAPSIRRRKLIGPEKVAAAEVADLNEDCAVHEAGEVR